jgi:hypothetical protein
MQAFRTFLGDTDMLADLAMMAPRLVELRRILKPTGSLYLHYGELTAPGTRNGRSGATWRGFDVTAIGRHWMTTVEKLDVRTPGSYASP